MNIYSVTDLGTLNGIRPVATAMNDAGVVVGSIGSRAMRYDGSLHALPNPSVATPVGEGGSAEKFEALGINDGTPEVIVGRRYTPDNAAGPFAVLWMDGVYVDLHASLDANSSEAYDVNDDGVIVGRADHRAFRFDPGPPDQPKYVQILTTTNEASCAKAINAQGHVVGWLDTYSLGSPVTVCFLHDGTLSKLPNLYGGDNPPLRVSHDDPIDISDGNNVVGGDNVGDHAFEYNYSTKQTTDINPPTPLLNGVRTIARGINKYNKVVGTKWNDVEGPEHFAVIWPPGEPMQKLIEWVEPPPDNLSLTDAVAINSKGHIAVIGHYEGEIPRSFLLAPVYERQPFSSPYTRLEQLVQVILFGSGGAGVLVPGGRRIYPKGPPIDPGGPFGTLDPAQRDVLVGLAVQVLAKNISDSEARRIAEAGGLQAIRMAVERLLPAVGQGPGH